jgi:lysophosphatidylcholine acyltransferase/lyso-PAF acetyltransferase
MFGHKVFFFLNMIVRL